MNFIKKVMSLFVQEQTDDDSSFKIKKSQAFDIADLDNNLKKDYYKNTKRGGKVELLFNDNRVNLIKLDGRNYWCVQILDADLYGLQLEDSSLDDDDDDANLFTTEDMKILRCLIDVETGEYVYYPYESAS